METSSTKILNSDAGIIIKLLNEALCEGWREFYQSFWFGSQLHDAKMKKEMEPEILAHVSQELNHGVIVANRIEQLGGTPVINPSDWTKLACSSYKAPIINNIDSILYQNLKEKRSAVRKYKKIIDFTRRRDQITNQIASRIFNEESEHEHHIELWLSRFVMTREDF